MTQKGFASVIVVLLVLLLSIGFIVFKNPNLLKHSNEESQNNIPSNQPTIAESTTQLQWNRKILKQ
jgi:hypothetical protein